jgi:hypothetical protein
MINKNKKELLCKFVDNKCESCHKKFPTNELHIHRLNRGYLGGTYTDFRNLKVLCGPCHKLIHFGEEF